MSAGMGSPEPLVKGRLRHNEMSQGVFAQRGTQLKPVLMGDLDLANTANACINPKENSSQPEAINKLIQPGTLQKEGQEEGIKS